MDKILLSLVLIGVLMVVITHLVISTKTSFSLLHGDLPPSSYIPGFVLRVVGMCALLVAFLCPMGWIFDGARLRHRTGKWYILLYLAVAAFFIFWSVLLACTVRHTYGCEFSSVICTIARLIITQAAFIFVAFATVQKPIRPLVLWCFAIFAMGVIVFDVWIWGTGIGSRYSNKLNMGSCSISLHD